MKKRTVIALTAVVLSVMLIGGALFFILRPTRNVWDIADHISHDDEFYVWIDNSQRHTHYIDSGEVQSAAENVLDDLKLSQRSIGNHPFNDYKNMIVLETSDHRVQYFLFNEDFTAIWAADNRWISANTYGAQNDGTYHAGMIFNASAQYNEWSNTAQTAYRVKNPRAVREFFKSVCEQDNKYAQ